MVRISCLWLIQVMEARMAECTFTPNINPSANETANSSISRFEQLFFDSESRRRRQRQYADWYPEEWVSIVVLIHAWNLEYCM